ncbi:hypothetical protein BVG79_00512 [Ketogulonicigenium robustum]|uniref:Cyclic di-GMP-binding protein n=1 Tax=Ketogulonicigenium robustum TaxID=92947 RepID=A0A1W6NXA9_9RHOB|nr:hypothetical protein [Ketogulonicigenium robustum]ARO13864.1 hypothetical protein BVG79_00512 [Ketogulonicigenium robustum]
MKWVLPVIGLGVLGAAGWASYVTVQLARDPDAVLSSTRVNAAYIPWAAGAPLPRTAEGPNAANTVILPVGATLPEREPVVSGLPGYGRMTYLLPRDTRVSAGDVVLQFASEIPENVNATLRISLNGTRRAEVLLPAGRDTREVRIPLQDQDLALNSTQVTFAITGVSTTGVCSINTGNALVSLLPGSTVQARSASAPQSAADQYRLAGARAGVRWAGVTGDDSRATTTVLAVSNALRQGLNVSVLGSDAAADPAFITTAQTIAALTETFDAATARTQAKWPLQITDPAAGAARSFTGTQSWRYSFSADDLPDRRVPARLDYGLTLGPLGIDGLAPLPQGSDGWMVSVMLNGHLLDSFAAAEGSLRRSATIPPTLTGAVNQLEVTVGRGFGAEGICNDGPTLVAELASDSVLVPGSTTITGIADQLGQMTGNTPQLLTDGVARLTPPEAQAAARMLADLPFAPATAQGTHAPSATISVLQTSALPAAAPASAWVYVNDARDQFVMRLDDPALRSKLDDHAVALLIAAPATTH